MAAPFPLSDRASDVRPGCKTQRIAPTLRQVADLMCARIKEREYFKTCIVGHVNCCLQCAPTLSVGTACPSSPCWLSGLRGVLFKWPQKMKNRIYGLSMACLKDRVTARVCQPEVVPEWSKTARQA
ncbi:hypothetical protein PoB_000952600 [Plakobranchus ocellatus]|uniref:Uncharacterized protein n=1 Tax=Plakobranchus ocellatus TaxID=259542 RepID=A0AAV3YKX1_9GAST|nr:hypothetical protein PoB_000952600 [Plakobranchus ocellatus]